MKGIPTHLNTKNDYLKIKNMFSREQWAPRFQDLLDSRFAWQPSGEVVEGDDGINDDTHQVVTQEMDGAIIRIQMELLEDENARIFRLGFTVAEIETYLG